MKEAGSDNHDQDAISYLKGPEVQAKFQSLDPEVFRAGFRVEGLVVRIPSDCAGEPLYGGMIRLLILDENQRIKSVKLQPLITRDGLFFTTSKAQIEGAVESRRKDVEGML